MRRIKPLLGLALIALLLSGASCALSPKKALAPCHESDGAAAYNPDGTVKQGWIALTEACVDRLMADVQACLDAAK